MLLKLNPSFRGIDLPVETADEIRELQDYLSLFLNWLDSAPISPLATPSVMPPAAILEKVADIHNDSNATMSGPAVATSRQANKMRLIDYVLIALDDLGGSGTHNAVWEATKGAGWLPTAKDDATAKRGFYTQLRTYNQYVDVRGGVVSLSKAGKNRLTDLGIVKPASRSTFSKSSQIPFGARAIDAIVQVIADSGGISDCHQISAKAALYGWNPQTSNRPVSAVYARAIRYPEYIEADGYTLMLTPAGNDLVSKLRGAQAQPSVDESDSIQKEASEDSPLGYGETDWQEEHRTECDSQV